MSKSNTAKRVRPVKAVKPAPAPAKAAAPKAAKPSVPKYDFHSNHTGPSDVSNTDVSRRPLALERFGTLPDAALTQRDKDAISAMRGEFGNKPFERRNLDVGILRRLGERGIITHVSGGETDPAATFRFSKAA